MKRKALALLLAITMVMNSGLTTISSAATELETTAQSESLATIPETESEVSSETETETESETATEVSTETEPEISSEVSSEPETETEQIMESETSSEEMVESESESETEKKKTTSEKQARFAPNGDEKVNGGKDAYYSQLQSSGSKIPASLARGANMTTFDCNAMFTGSGLSSCSYAGLGQVAKHSKVGIDESKDSVKVTTAPGKYKKTASAWYNGGIRYVAGGQILTGYVKVTVTGYSRMNKADAYFQFRADSAGVNTHGMSWVGIRYDFYDSDKNPINVNGYTVFKDVDLQQGMSFMSGHGFVRAYGYTGTNIKTVADPGFGTYFYTTSTTNDNIGNTGNWLGVQFSGNHLQVRYTFERKGTENLNASGSMHPDYEGSYDITPTISKFTSNAQPNITGGIDNATANVAGFGDYYAYRIRITVPAKAKINNRRILVEDALPEWADFSEKKYTIINHNASANWTSSWQLNTSGNYFNFLNLNDTVYGTTTNFILWVKVRDRAYFKAKPPATDQWGYVWNNSAMIRYTPNNFQSYDYAVASNSVSTHMAIPTKPAYTIEKTVNNSATMLSGTSNTVDGYDSTYYYYLRVTLGDLTQYKQAFDSVVVTDAIPNWVDVKKIERVDSSGNVVANGGWTYATNGNSVTLRNTALLDASSYGTSIFRVTVKVKDRTSFTSQKAKENLATNGGKYYWYNAATLTVDGSSVASGKVTTYMPKPAQPTPTINKRVSNTRVSSATTTSNTVSKYGDMYYYYVTVDPGTLTKKNDPYTSLTVEDTIPEWVTINKVERLDKNGTVVTTERSNYGWRSTIAGQKFTATGYGFTHVSFYQPTTFRITVWVKDKANFNAKTVKKSGGNFYWTNQASVKTSERILGSNVVTTYMKQPGDPVFSISKAVNNSISAFSTTDTSNTVTGYNGTYYYYVRVTAGKLNAGDAKYNTFRVEDTLPSWVTYQSAQVYDLAGNSQAYYWDVSYSRGKITAIGNSTRDDFYGKSYVIRITAKVNSSFSTDPAKTIRNGAIHYYWRNTASVTVDKVMGEETLNSNAVVTYMERKTPTVAIRKAVTNSGSLAAASDVEVENTVYNYGDTYYYWLTIDVGSVENIDKFTTLYVNDTLPKWASFSSWDVYYKNGTNYTHTSSRWSLTRSGNGITLTPDNISRDDFYNKTYSIRIAVKVQNSFSSVGKPSVKNDKYYWTNKITLDRGADGSTLTSNEVTTYFVRNTPSVTISKAVNNNNVNLAVTGTSNTLAGYGEKYYYFLNVTTGSIAGKDSIQYLTFEDTIPQYVKVNSAKAYRRNGTKYVDASGQWNVSINGNKVSGEAKSGALNLDDFYNKKYVIVVEAQALDRFTTYPPTVSGKYQWTNTFSLVKDELETLNSNTVYTNMTKVYPGVKIQKGVDNSSTTFSDLTFNNSMGKGTTYYYYLKVTTDSSVKKDYYTRFRVEDTLPKWVIPGSVTLNYRYGSSYRSASTYLSSSISGQKITITGKNLRSDDFYNKEFLIRISATVRSTFSTDPETENGKLVWKNKATVTVDSGTKTSNEVKTYLREDTIPYSITKYVSNTEMAIGVKNQVVPTTTSNSVRSRGSTYYYYLKVDVGDYDASKAYKSFVIKDTLPDWVDFSGTPRVTEKSSDGIYWLSNMSNFNVVTKGADMEISMTSPSSSLYYNKSYIIKIPVKVKTKWTDLEKLPKIQGNNYYWDNTATIEVNGDSENSNSVRTTYTDDLPVFSIRKAITPDEPSEGYYVLPTAETNTVSGHGDVYYYHVIFTIGDVAENGIENATVRDTLPEEVELAGDPIVYGYNNNYLSNPYSWSTQVSKVGARIKITSEFADASPYNMVYDLCIPVRVKSNGFENPHYTSNKKDGKYFWKNNASITIDGGEGIKMSAYSNEVTTYCPYNPTTATLKKAVSNTKFDPTSSGEPTGTTNTIRVGQTYYYYLISEIGDLDGKDKLRNLNWRDYLPEYVEYTGSGLTMYRKTANGSYSTDSSGFDGSYSSAANVIAWMSDGAVYKDESYGKKYVIEIPVRVKSNFMEAPQNSNGLYYWNNKATLSIDEDDPTKNLTSNSVTTYLKYSLPGTKLTKVVTNASNLAATTTENTVKGYGSTYYYNLKLTIDPLGDKDKFDSLEIKDTLPNWVNYSSATVYKMSGNTGTAASNWSITNSSGTVTAKCNNTSSSAIYGSTYMLQIKATVKSSFTTFPEKSDGKYFWTNVGTVYANGVDSDSNEVVTYFERNMPTFSIIKAVNNSSTVYTTKDKVNYVTGYGTYYYYYLTVKVGSNSGKEYFDDFRVEDTLPEWVNYSTSYLTYTNGSAQASANSYFSSSYNAATRKLTITGKNLTSAGFYNKTYVFRISTYVKTGPFNPMPESAGGKYFWTNEATASAKDCDSITSNKVMTYWDYNDPVYTIRKGVSTSNLAITGGGMTTEYTFSNQQSNKVDKIGDQYYYYLSVSVTDPTARRDYKSFSIEDNLPYWVTATGDPVVKTPDSNVKAIWTAKYDSTTNVVKITADASNNYLYGETVIFEIPVTVQNRFDVKPKTKGDGKYYWENTAVVNCNGTLKNTNTVETVLDVLPQKATYTISKAVNNSSTTYTGLTNTVTNCGNFYYYYVTVTVNNPVNRENFASMIWDDEIPEWVEVTDVRLTTGSYSSYWDVAVNGNRVVAIGAVANSGFYGKTYRFRITCRVKDSFANEPEVSGNRYVWRNTAGITVDAEHRDSNTVQTYLEFSLRVIKNDKSTGDKLAGAVLRLETEDGGVVREFVSKREPENFVGLAPGNYVVREVRAPEGYALADPVQVTITANSSTKIVTLSDIPLAKVTVTKKIKADEVTWAHGNPIFVFELTGKDMDSVEHTYFGSVEFKEQEVAEEGGWYSATYVFDNVPIGDYQLQEKDALGYYLSSVESDSEGVAITRLATPSYGKKPAELFSTRVVTTTNRNPSVVFRNLKQTFDDFRHTDRVVNSILIQ